MDLIEDPVSSFVVTLRTDSGIISSGKEIMNFINRGVRNKRINGHFQITLRHNICVNKRDTIYINTQALAKQSAFLTAVLNVYERICMTSLWDYMVTGQRYELKAEDLLDKNVSVFQKMSVIPFMFVGEVLNFWCSSDFCFGTLTRFITALSVRKVDRGIVITFTS